MGVAEHEVLMDDELIEKDFNDALASLQKSLKSGSDGSLFKAKDEESEEEYDEEESEEEGEDEDYEKSMSDILAEDPEAAAAMDVEPFLRQLVKAIDESVSEVYRKVASVEKLAKSQGRVVEMAAKLQKSSNDMMRQMGGQPMPRKSVTRMEKSRFETGDDAKEFDNNEVLLKSRDWVQTKKIDLNEAGMIEGRINKGRLGLVGDRLDHKVAALLREDS